MACFPPWEGGIEGGATGRRSSAAAVSATLPAWRRPKSPREVTSLVLSTTASSPSSRFARASASCSVEASNVLTRISQLHHSYRIDIDIGRDFRVREHGQHWEVLLHQPPHVQPDPGRTQRNRNVPAA